MLDDIKCEILVVVCCLLFLLFIIQNGGQPYIRGRGSRNRGAYILLRRRGHATSIVTVQTSTALLKIAT